MSIVKMQHKGQMTIPRSIRSQVGLADGDLVEVTAAAGRIVITPKLAIDRSKFPTADDEYTPAQRRIVDARLAKATAEVKKGHLSPAFETIAGFAASLKADAKKLKTKTKRSGRR
ncbi:MAG: AbrB/MazE/SpoVT family DNA-binding domain-containing protein [Bryobacteraceae bacterium]